MQNKKDSLKESLKTIRNCINSIKIRVEPILAKKTVRMAFKIVKYARITLNPAKRDKLVIYIGLDLLESYKRNKKKD